MKCRTTEAVGAAIREARLFRGYTQKGLADQVYVSNQTISRYENTLTGIDLDTLFMIFDALNMDCALSIEIKGEE